jgi:Ribulose-5-phosphate 4-epimerase and related epimerases and aldolases
MSDTTRLLLEFCRRAHDKNFVSGSGGNISVRDGDDILITPTGRNLGLLTEQDIVRMRPDGSVVGGGKPSQEWRMHCLCYARRDVESVVHVHSVHVSAVSCMELDPVCAMPVYTPGYSVRVGKLPVVPYYRPGSEDLAAAVAPIIAGTPSFPGRNSVLLANHGMLSVGPSLEKAFNLTEEIEENAQIFLLLGRGGRALTDAQQAELVGKY